MKTRSHASWVFPVFLLGSCCLHTSGEPEDAGIAGPSCTIGNVVAADRSANPNDPSLCCNAAQQPRGWTRRFVDGGFFADGTPRVRAVAGDFNGDGWWDLALLDPQNNRIEIRLNQRGTLVASAEVSLNADLWDLAAVDLDRDGFTDLVTQNANGTLSVLRSRGDGRFDPGVTYPACAPGWQSLKAGDFNGDQVPDLICGCGLFFAGIGDGGLLPAVPTRVPADGPATVEDFNGDGKLDLAVDGFATGTVSVSLGGGNGHFSSAGTYSPSGPSVFDMASGDFDGDGFVDLAVQSATSRGAPAWTDQGISFLKGLGDGRFGTSTWIPLGDGTPGRVAVADLAGDGNRELLVASGPSLGQLTLSSGAARMAPMASASGPVFWPTIGDFNGDGAQDLALRVEGQSTGVAVYLNGCP